MTILRYVILGLAVFIAVAVGWRSAGGSRPVWFVRIPGVIHAKVPPSKAGPATAAAVPAPAAAAMTLSGAHDEIVKDLDAVPQFSGFYQHLAAGFPHVFADLVDRASEALSKGGTPPSAGALIWDALRALQQSNGILAAGADEEALARFFDARLAMLDVLAGVDQRGCADFLYGATDPSIEGFSTAHRDLVADMADKQLAAIEDGQLKRLEPAAPSPEDLDLVATGLSARQLNPDEISMLLDGKTLDPPLPDARLCEIGRTYLAVLKSLPVVVRQRIYGFTAELLARS